MTTILLLTTADAEIFAAAGAVATLPGDAPRVRALNPDPWRVAAVAASGDLVGAVGMVAEIAVLALIA